MNKFARLIARLKRRAIPGIILFIITVVIFPGLPTFPNEVDALASSQLPPFVGRVCLVPGESTSCPLTLPAMIGSSSGHLNVSINILGSTIFNSFDISVRWDTKVMNATTVDLTGTILPSFTVTARCINGFGSGCGILDGPGIAHVAALGTNTTAPTSGRLFKIPFFIGSGVSGSVGFQTGCFLPNAAGPPIPSGSVPNTSACVMVGIVRTIGIPSVTPVPEGIQSQLLGVSLPTPLGSLGGNIAGLDTGGSAPNFADTFVMPLAVALPGNITTWKVQFRPLQLSIGLSDPIGVQIKVLRKTSATALTVVGAGLVHNPRPILQSRVLGYPFVLTEWTVTEFFSDPGIAVLPGDLIGLTIMSDPFVGLYIYPFVNATGTRAVASNVTLGGTIDLSSPFTSTLPQGPALQVFIQLPPPTTDTAGDGIPDFVKLSPEMQAFGADPCRKTVAAQLDYMVRPRQDAINTVIASFDAAPVPAVLPCPYPGFPLKSSGVKLILDVANAVPFQNVLNFTHSGPLSFDSVKAAFFDPNRVRYFHYGIFAQEMADGSTVSGAAEVFGPNFMVTLGGWPNGGSVSEQAGTIMHELGHNLGLDHGGNSTVSFKPNYLSVMNYIFQVVGITTQIPGGGNVTRFDYSSQTLLSLNESALDERVGLSNSNDITRWACPDGRHVKFGLVSGPMDWNCNGVTDNTLLRVDINNDTAFGTLPGFNDWASLRYKFTESAAFGVGCNIGCHIGCNIGCHIGTELTFPQAAVIEAQWKAFFATPQHSTSTSVNCVPGSVSVSGVSLCTATVTDINVGTTVTPTGNVTFSSFAGSFTPTAVCKLSGTGASASCSVTYSPGTGNVGLQTISSAYPGDTSHFANGGSTTVNALPPLTVSVFFTDSSVNPLPLDQKGNPEVNVVLAVAKVTSTNPGVVTAWVKVTNPGPSSLQSVAISDTLPVDWDAHPTFLPARGAVSVFFVRTDGTAIEITNQASIATTTGNPETVSVAIGNMTATAAGGALGPGQSILLQVNLRYVLIGTSQAARSYPRNYTDTATANAWSMPSFGGSQASGTSSAFFTAYAKVIGDVDGDFNVDINDLALLAHSYGTRAGDALWNPAADFNNDGVVDVSDLALLAFYYGTSS